MFRILGINLLVLLVLVVAAELFFGDWITPRDFGALNLPRNSVRTFDVENLYGGGTITHTRDDYGLRGSYGSLADIDILAIGGSTTNELYVDDDAIWTAVLERNLRMLDPAWDVTNAGAEGQSTIGHMYNFDAWFPNLEGLAPKYVIAYIGVNDVAVENHADYDALTTPNESKNFAQWFKNQSAIYRLYKVVRGMLEARDAKVIHGGGAAFTGPWQEVPPPSLDGNDDFRERVGQYEVRVGKLIDLGSELRFCDNDFYDWVHTTASGSGRIGDYLFERLKGEIAPKASK